MDRDEVEDRLRRLEDEYDVTVLCARDFGSRAWNVDGPSSDRDVAFVFKQDALDYIRLGTRRRSIDFKIRGNTFAGWNLTRFAELLVESNPTVLEVLNSDLGYRECGEVWEDLRDYANRRFKPIALMGHYRSLAEGNYQTYVATGDDTTAKRYLYVLRALLYGRWVAETHRMPPLDFVAFLDEYARAIPFEDERHVIETARRCVDEKKNDRGGTELGNPLRDWIETELERDLDPGVHDVRGIERERVNAFVTSFFEELDGGA